MALQLIVKLVSLICAVSAFPTTENSDATFTLHDRASWGAAAATDTRQLATPVPYVVLHHTYIPGACNTTLECAASMRAMQRYHVGLGWGDIGYNFAVGGDGAVYEGRGWALLGAHALHFNTVSLGVCLIGDWSDSLPPRNQLKAVQALIAEGVARGAITPNYRLVGHRQVRANTSCPGDALFNHIQTWKQYSAFPASWRDLVDVPELPKSDRDVVRRSLLEF
ncbi:peptidoglycan-recognition protein SC2-like isoform X3 [Plutella xylostella]|uniref:peptidoglycan-recognition protein SC2-like isoform X3 n=1 Tax=Plutella xylostella TaxID=51655 RepID=UPI002032CC61|nr:peptidoglycan-recognition protein SC2-like isoform X3 [Plutella xylostella]